MRIIMYLMITMVCIKTNASSFCKVTFRLNNTDFFDLKILDKSSKKMIKASKVTDNSITFYLKEGTKCRVTLSPNIYESITPEIVFEKNFIVMRDENVNITLEEEIIELQLINKKLGVPEIYSEDSPILVAKLTKVDEPNFLRWCIFKKRENSFYSNLLFARLGKFKLTFTNKKADKQFTTPLTLEKLDLKKRKVLIDMKKLKKIVGTKGTR